MIKMKRLAKSFYYAFKGLAKIFREEQNLRVESIAGALAVALGFYFQINRYEWMIVALAIGLVFLMEVVNSAVERVTDVLKPRIHDYVKQIKDIMAAAVMISALVAIIIGLLIFWPYVFGLSS